MGFGVNSEAFERLARSMPLLFLQKHADSLLQTEAFLFGQAGLLSDGQTIDDPYYQRLSREYDFLRNKFSLSPINSESWKFFRLRPANFPHQRIALLAQLIHREFNLFARLLDCDDEKSIQSLLDIHLEGYWDTHYTFGVESPPRAKTLGRGAVRLLIINCVAPLFYAYAIRSGNEYYTDKAMRLLEELPAEDNHIVRRIADAGIKVQSALDSQAAIQLHTAYCEPHKCIFCRIGIVSSPKTLSKNNLQKFFRRIVKNTKHLAIAHFVFPSKADRTRVRDLMLLPLGERFFTPLCYVQNDITCHLERR